MIVNTHVHVFTADRKKYPQSRDTPRAGSIPSSTDSGQTEWPLTTIDNLIAPMNEAGGDKATLVQASFAYEYDNSHAIAAAREGGGKPAALYAKLVDVFGAKRIMWSSNYPAHPKFGRVKPPLNESKKVLAFLSAEDQAWTLGKSALAFYPALQSSLKPSRR